MRLIRLQTDSVIVKDYERKRYEVYPQFNDCHESHLMQEWAQKVSGRSCSTLVYDEDPIIEDLVLYVQVALKRILSNFLSEFDSDIDMMT
jgi:hypothetical protein